MGNCRLSPQQQLSGRTPDEARDFKCKFGDLIGYEDIPPTQAEKSLVTRPRIKHAMWLRPAFDDHGSAEVLDLTSLLISKQSNYTEILWTSLHQHLLDNLYKFAKLPRSDGVMTDVQWTSGGKTYNLLVLPPDPEAEVEFDNIDNVELVFGNSNVHAMPTRHKMGMDIPVLVTNHKELNTAALELVEVNRSEIHEDTGTEALGVVDDDGTDIVRNREGTSSEEQKLLDTNIIQEGTSSHMQELSEGSIQEGTRSEVQKLLDTNLIQEGTSSHM